MDVTAETISFTKTIEKFSPVKKYYDTELEAANSIFTMKSMHAKSKDQALAHLIVEKNSDEDYSIVESMGMRFDTVLEKGIPPIIIKDGTKFGKVSLDTTKLGHREATQRKANNVIHTFLKEKYTEFIKSKNGAETDMEDDNDAADNVNNAGNNGAVNNCNTVDNCNTVVESNEVDKLTYQIKEPTDANTQLRCLLKEKDQELQENIIDCLFF